MADETERKTQALREATREANLTLAEFKDVMREWRELQNSLGPTVHQMFEEKAQAQIDADMIDAKRQILKAVEDAEKGIRKRLDLLANIVQQGISAPSVEDIIKLEACIRWLKKGGDHSTLAAFFAEKGMISARLTKK
jgi:hypothetical protein